MLIQNLSTTLTHTAAPGLHQTQVTFAHLVTFPPCSRVRLPRIDEHLRQHHSTNQTACCYCVSTVSPACPQARQLCNAIGKRSACTLEPTAWAVGLFLSACWQNVTGAAAMTFVVNTPAATAGA